MKRLFVIIMLLLFLAACSGPGAGASGTEENGGQGSGRPAQTEATPGTDAEPDAPELLLVEGEKPRVSGPAGDVLAALNVGGPLESATCDIDGDGQPELVYRGGGVTSGAHSELVLELSDDGLFCCPSTYDWDSIQMGYVQEATAPPLSLTVRGGRFLLNGGQLPDGIEEWKKYADCNCFGVSFSALRARVQGNALLDLPNCLVWQEPEHLRSDYHPEEEAYTYTFAAVSDNGVTVTKLLRWTWRSDEFFLSLCRGTSPIQPVADPQALARMTEAKLNQRLGPCHFALDSGDGHSVPCWFTEDGKLLAVWLTAGSERVELWDLTGSLPIQ